MTNIENILGTNLFKKKIIYSKNSSLESQIASISDDIAYNSHDLEDGLNANLFNIEELKNIPILSDIIKKNNKKINKYNKELVIRQIIREIINEMVKDVILNTKKNIKFYKINSIKDVYSSQNMIVTFSNQMNEFDRSIKNFLRDNMYYSQEVLKKTNEGKKIVKKLFLEIIKKPKSFISAYDIKKNSKERTVCDFIAGMTDRYAINLYNSIK